MDCYLRKFVLIMTHYNFVFHDERVIVDYI